MLAIKKTPIQGLLFLIICLSYSLTEAARYKEIGDIMIRITKDTFHCDKLQCPLATLKYCAITEETDRYDASVLSTLYVCTFMNGQKPKMLRTERKVDPKTKIHVSIRAARNGQIRSFRTQNGVDEVKDYKI